MTPFYKYTTKINTKYILTIIILKILKLILHKIVISNFGKNVLY